MLLLLLLPLVPLLLLLLLLLAILTVGHLVLPPGRLPPRGQGAVPRLGDTNNNNNNNNHNDNDRINSNIDKTTKHINNSRCSAPRCT